MGVPNLTIPRARGSEWPRLPSRPSASHASPATITRCSVADLIGIFSMQVSRVLARSLERLGEVADAERRAQQATRIVPPVRYATR